MKKATDNLPLDMKNVYRLLINFSGDCKNISMSEITKVKESLSEANSNLCIKWGLTQDNTLDNKVKVTLIASGIS
ncbi:MAG: hypothetical protein K2K97_08900 [Muribaculaceae bacterium]|nr:hypothetical protein [Muribaculaceae bacterium]